MHSTQGPSGRAYHHASHGTPEDVIKFTVQYEEFHLNGYVMRDLDVKISVDDILCLAADHARTRRETEFLEYTTDAEVLGIPE